MGEPIQPAKAGLRPRGRRYRPDLLIRGRVLPVLGVRVVSPGNTPVLVRLSCTSTARSLALALLVTNVFANHHDASVATDDLALVADLFDAGLHLHGYSFSSFYWKRLLLVTVDNAAAGEVIG